MKRRAFVATAASAARVWGANDRVRAAILGSGGRGRFLTGEFKEIGVEMAGVCDVYEANLAAGLKVASTGAKPFDNYKRVLEDKSFDAVIVATPDHWHARMVIDAVEAGKDVYVEKPLAHKIDEGFAIIDAVRRTRRVVQVGMQRRSYDVFLEAKEAMVRADIGEVRHVNAWWYNRQDGLSSRQFEGKVDWKQWLGAAPNRDLDANRFFNWYYFYDYSGGLMIGQAAHIMDAIHWFRGVSYPSAVYAAGVGAYAGAEVPATTTMCVEYPEGVLATFTVGYNAMRYSGYLDQMKQFHGSKARFDIGREGWALYPEQPQALELNPTLQKSAPKTFNSATRQHIRNFLECIQSRKDPNATVEMGQWTNVVLCMAIDSLRTGRRLRWDAARKVAV